MFTHIQAAGVYKYSYMYMKMSNRSLSYQGELTTNFMAAMLAFMLRIRISESHAKRYEY